MPARARRPTAGERVRAAATVDSFGRSGFTRDSVYLDVVTEEPGIGGPAGLEAVSEPEARESAESAETQPSPAAGAEHKRATWDDPRTPWAGRPRRIDILCWAGIMASGIYYYALLPFRATLVGTHPVLGDLLNGSTEDIIAAAAFARVGHGSLVIVL